MVILNGLAKFFRFWCRVDFQSHVQLSGGDPSSSDSTADWQVKWIKGKKGESTFQTHRIHVCYIW